MLRNTAYLVITDRGISDTDAVFELRHDLEVDETVEKSYLIGNFGTAIQEAARYTGTAELLTGEDVPERRQGFSLDAAGGEWGGSLTFATGLEDVRWGDGSGGEGQANITTTDASGDGVDPLTRLQVLTYWTANSISDSRGQTRLHVGHWTDGSFDDVREGETVPVDAGVYGTPIPINIMSVEPQKPEDDTTAMTGTLQYRRTQVAGGVLEDVADWIGDLGDAASELVSDVAEDLPDA